MAETVAKSAQIAERQATTTAFHNTVSRLASEKIEERLGGIYMLERIARGSLDEYWTVMEDLCAFARERTKWKEPETAPKPTMALEQSSPTDASGASPQEPATDIAAALIVIGRRPEAGRALEQKTGWWLDLNRTNLSGANLIDARLEAANLR